jgi:hypothetical protein
MVGVGLLLGLGVVGTSRSSSSYPCATTGEIGTTGVGGECEGRARPAKRSVYPTPKNLESFAAVRRRAGNVDVADEGGRSSDGLALISILIVAVEAVDIVLVRSRGTPIEEGWLSSCYM